MATRPSSAEARSSARQPSATTMSVDAPAPRIVRHMPGRLRLRFVAPPLDVADDAVAESAEIRLDLAENRRGQPPPQIGRQERVAVVRIGEPWACLVEIVHFDNLVP